MSNLDYWKATSGQSYKNTQDSRRKSGNTAYQAQEDWLFSFLTRLVKERGQKPLQLLDYGCGFGRMAHVVSRVEGVDYSGFDISKAMLGDFERDAPKAIQINFADRVRVGDQIEQAFPGDKLFDVILTVSVLIHNTPEIARKTVLHLLKKLRPDGSLVLIENQLTAVSAMSNFWHGGCWGHFFPEYFDGAADVEVIDGLAGQHAIYIASPVKRDKRSAFGLRQSPGARLKSVDLENLRVLGLPRAQEFANALMVEWAESGQRSASEAAAVHDLSERLASAEKTNAEALALLQSENQKLRTQFGERQAIKDNLAQAVREAASQMTSENQPVHTNWSQWNGTSAIEWNAKRDTIYSHSIPGFEKVLHIFQKEWVGIRAAAGSLPGEKLAITANSQISASDILAVLDEIDRRGYEKLVFHGYSRNTSSLITTLARQGYTKSMYLVFHGAVAAWINEGEKRNALEAMDLANRNLIRRFHVMKRSFKYPVSNLFEPMLFNMSPKIEGFNPTGVTDSRLNTVFIPGWPLWHKNIYTSVVAAAQVTEVRDVQIYAENLSLPPSLSKKISVVKHATRESTLNAMAEAALCLNVSLVDCHPMVNVESQSVGCPCLRGNLSLDALESHPYVSLTQVGDPTSVADIHGRITKLLSVPKVERTEMTLDYQRESDLVSLSRYREFLEV